MRNQTRNKEMNELNMEQTKRDSSPSSGFQALQLTTGSVIHVSWSD